MKNWLRVLPMGIAIAVVMGFLAFTLLDTRTATNEAHRALCGLKFGYQDQLRHSKTYLKQHPNGAPSISVSRADIQNQILSLKDRIKSLSDIRNCAP